MSKDASPQFLNPPARGRNPFAKFNGKKRETRYGRRHKPGEMNKTETEYADILEASKLAGEILDWKFEAITLKLADDSRHTLDFTVFHSDGSFEFINVKGGGPIDPNSLTKIKFAAEKFWMFKFSMVQKLSKKAAAEYGSAWKRTEF